MVGNDNLSDFAQSVLYFRFITQLFNFIDCLIRIFLQNEVDLIFEILIFGLRSYIILSLQPMLYIVLYMHVNY